jgi:Zn-dependent metalloprotease
LRVLSLTQSFLNARTGYDESKRTVRQALRTRRAAAINSLLDRVARGQKRRTIYTANNTQRLPGNRVRSEGDPPTGDPAVDEAYEYMGDTYDFYLEVFNRDSVDDQGFPLNGTVHFGRDYDNAFWDGQRMIYGDGDGEQFERFTKSVDVIGHELTHGVTQYEAALIYWGQPGALNESISDVFGSLVKQYVNNQKAEKADWIIGEGLFTPNVNGVGIRSMKEPGTAYDDPVLGKDPQPAHMKNYVKGFQDNGGVHINSGIPNHAFYLAAVKLGGYAWEKAGLIWYQTLQSPLLQKAARFSTFARLTVLMARQLFPGGGEQQAVRESWAEVGIVV